MQTRNKLIIGIAVTFFLLVNTNDLWTDNLGFYSMIFSIILFLTFISLSITVIIQLFYSIKERFRKRERNLTNVILVFVLILIFFMLFGFLNIKKIESKDILVANREGVANYTTTLKLKESNEFTFSTICFGTWMTKGEFTLVEDTIFFNKVQLGREVESFFEFGIQDNENRITLFNHKQDTVGLRLKVIERKSPNIVSND